MLVACGLNQNIPVEYREKIVIQASHLNACLVEIHQLEGVHECMILSTCHRTEIYAIVDDPQILMDWWQARHQSIWHLLTIGFYCYLEEEAVRHALRVAAGLDSMLIGETQIFGQLKQAFHHALELKFVKRQLIQWFEFICQMTKKIRTQSGISQYPISVASVAVDLIVSHLGNVNDKKVLIIGSGDTARLSAVHLQEKGCTDFIVTSRHFEHAKQLADHLNGQARAVTELHDFMYRADIVVTATSCPLPFITKLSMEQTLCQRQNRSMILVDLAVPRDIEPEVGMLDAIKLVNIDNLKEIQEKNQVLRQEAGLIAEKMIMEALNVYQQKNKTKKVQHLICDYRAYMQNLAQDEVKRAHQKLASGHCQFEVVQELSERLIKKFMHQTTLGLQKAAIDKSNHILEMAQYLFNTHY